MNEYAERLRKTNWLGVSRDLAQWAAYQAAAEIEMLEKDVARWKQIARNLRSEIEGE